MGGVIIPFVPAGVWLAATSMLIAVLLLVFGFYLYHKNRIRALGIDSGDLAALASEKQLRQADVESLRHWMTAQQDELVRLRAEREEQERVRAELAHLEQACAAKDQENEILRKEAGELESQRYFLQKDQERLSREVGDLEAKRKEADALKQQLDELRRQADNAQEILRQAAEQEIRLSVLATEKIMLEQHVQEIKAVIDKERPAAEEVRKLESALDDMRREQADLSATLDALRSELHAREQNIAQLKKQEVDGQEALVMLQHQVQGARQETEQVRATLTQARESLAKTQSVMRERQADVVALEARKAALDREVEQSKTVIDQERPAAAEVQEAAAALKTMRREQANLSDTLNALRSEQHAREQNIMQLKKQDGEGQEVLARLQHQVQGARQETEQVRATLTQASESLVKTQSAMRERQADVVTLEARKAALDRAVEELEGSANGNPTAQDPWAPYRDLLRAPEGFKNSFPGGEDKMPDEKTALRHFREVLTDKGLLFPQRVIDAFHTSLKCHDINPLTVLAGVSGTGKTLLPIAYARVMGMHSLVISVQPRWDSPQDMFGFYNYMEKQYKATDLSRALLCMDPYNYPRRKYPMLGDPWAQNRMLLVLLDEMNLARTEYYFSEFLSKLELRRLVKDADKPADRKDAEIELDVGPGKGVRFPLWVGPNVLFVGTMNEDETTQTLSDKVLDRSNVLRFGKPSDTKAHQDGCDTLNIPLSERFLSWERWKSWIRHFETGAPWSAAVQKTITLLNAAMDDVGRPFGYRMRDAFLEYVANYPLVNEADRFNLAVADQIEQKVLPKLRGIDCTTERAASCLQDLERIIAPLGDSELAKAFKSARDESMSIGMFQWRGVVRAPQTVAKI